MKVETMPVDLKSFSKPPIQFKKHFIKSQTEPEIYFENLSNQKSSSREAISMLTTKKTILGGKWSKIKKLKWKYFFVDILLKEICIFSILIFLIQIQSHVHQYIYCEIDNSDILVVIYTICRDIFLIVYFYLLFAYYAFISCWPEATDRKTMILWLFITIAMYLLKIYKVDSFDNNFDIFAICFLVQSCRVIAFYKRQLLSWEIFKSKTIPFFFLICFLFNYYAMKWILIPLLKKELTQEFDNSYLGNFIFQSLLFVYFKIYYKIFLSTLENFVNLQNYSGFQKNCLVTFSKYFLIDAVCSSAPSAVIGSLQYPGAWMGISNFLYQILVLYDENFDVFKNLKFLIFKLCKKKIPKIK